MSSRIGTSGVNSMKSTVITLTPPRPAPHRCARSQSMNGLIAAGPARLVHSFSPTWDAMNPASGVRTPWVTWNVLQCRLPESTFSATPAENYIQHRQHQIRVKSYHCNLYRSAVKTCPYGSRTINTRSQSWQSQNITDVVC